MLDIRCAVVLAATAFPVGAALAQDRTELGTLLLVMDDSQQQLEMFHGPIDGLFRALSSYRTGFGGDGGLILIEAVSADVPAGAHPMQGAAILRIEFSAPAPLDANSPYDDMSLFYVGDWPAGAQEPEQAFANAGDMELYLEVLDFTQDNARVAGATSGKMCPYDIDTEQTDAGADACFNISVQFETALVPFGPPVPLDEMPQVAMGSGPDTSLDSPPTDDGPVTMDVLGTISAKLDGEDREWLTIAGQLNGEDGASANWQCIEMSIPSFADGVGAVGGVLSDEERAQLGMLDDMFSGGNPMAEMMEQITGQPVGGGEHINLTISGHDPASPNILTEQVLALDVFLTSAEPPLGVPIPADISYFVESSGGFIPAVFYFSGEDDAEASVTFDQLDLTPGGGHASGSFRASLCRMEGARLMDGADLSDCMPVEGRFDTALIEEAAYSP